MKFYKNLGGVQADPRRWDELGPSKIIKNKKLVPGKRWNELGLPETKNVKNWGGGVQAGPRR